jgi:geranylgeranyl diphosphate synthase, type I
MQQKNNLEKVKDANFKKYLENVAGDLDWEIDHILSQYLNEIKKFNPKLTPFVIALMNSCKGGKRIRGALVKLGFEIVSGSYNAQIAKPEIIRVGAAYEIFHASILIHDDIVDQSDMRRGRLTLYRALGGNLPSGRQVHYGISQALLLADVGFFLSTKLIADCKLPDAFKAQALSHFSKVVIDTGWGEILDMELSNLKDQETGYSGQEEDVLAIHRLKTARYTISGPLQIGAILAGGEDGLLRSLEEFGENLGLAFQIQDDILGVFGDEKELGKSVTSDMEEGKNTLLITESLKNANQKQKEFLEKHYGKGKIGNKTLQQIRKIFQDTSSLVYSKSQAVKYVGLAESVIPEITQDKDLEKLLTEMAYFLVERSK